MEKYNAEFFEFIVNSANASAEVVVPIVVELLNPLSVVDLGCGEGTWLSEFCRRGVTDVFGIDGDYVDRKKLAIPESAFLAKDLNCEVSLDRRFDLAVSLEVAEHLSPRSSISHVRSLTGLADVVLFSAAAPGQGGTNHLNEQWPSYWQDLFESQGFRRIDVVRPQIWNNRNVAWWYRQNILVFASDRAIAKSECLSAAFSEFGSADMEFVHRDVILKHATFFNLCRRTAAALSHAVRRKFL